MLTQEEPARDRESSNSRATIKVVYNSNGLSLPLYDRVKIAKERRRGRQTDRKKLCASTVRSLLSLLRNLVLFLDGLHDFPVAKHTSDDVAAAGICCCCKPKP